MYTEADNVFRQIIGTCGVCFSVVVEALGSKPECRGFETQ
jgi:hypothetical protein